MTSSLIHEELIRLARTGDRFPGAPHPSTVRRYADQGFRGIVLETVCVGGKRFTSRQAIDRFIKAQNRMSAAEVQAQRCGDVDDEGRGGTR
jgi:hypothetical protein